MTNGLTKTLTLPDLILFGITIILGSGGFNLIGDAIKNGSYYFPITLLGSGALFLGSANSYTYAHDKYKTNISESKLIESVFGSTGKNISIISILIYNIFAVATILSLSSKLLFPLATTSGQISFSLLLLLLMSLSAYQKLEINKEIVSVFSYGIILLIGFASLLGLTGLSGLTQSSLTMPLFPTKINLYESFLYFFFVLAGHDGLIKFSEETVNYKDLDKSIYISILISIILVSGLSLSAIVWIKDFTKTNLSNIVADIYEKSLDHGSHIYITILAIFLMIGTTFLSFLASIRYLYGITETIPMLEFIRSGGDGNVSLNSIIIVSALCSIALMIQQLTSLVEVSDIALIFVLLLVSFSSFYDKYKNNETSTIDLSTSIGFIAVLIFTIKKHIF
jgi:hypothetical protein